MSSFGRKLNMLPNMNFMFYIILKILMVIYLMMPKNLCWNRLQCGGQSKSVELHCEQNSVSPYSYCFGRKKHTCTAAGFCVRCEKEERAAWCLCLSCHSQLSPFVLGVKKGKSSKSKWMHCINTWFILHSINKVSKILE